MAKLESIKDEYTDTLKKNYDQIRCLKANQDSLESEISSLKEV